MQTNPEIDASDLLKAGQVAIIFDLDMTCGLALPVAKDPKTRAPESVITAATIYVMMSDPEFRTILQQKINEFVTHMRGEMSMVSVHKVVTEYQSSLGLPGGIPVVGGDWGGNNSGGMN